jgi:hypothetical protein
VCTLLSQFGINKDKLSNQALNDEMIKTERSPEEQGQRDKKRKENYKARLGKRSNQGNM